MSWYRPFRRVTVLDISRAALDRAAERLGSRAGLVRWVAGDVTTVELPEARYDFWHDRAVFHFLTEEAHAAGTSGRCAVRCESVGGS